jgi:hypothetical protein
VVGVLARRGRLVRAVEVRPVDRDVLADALGADEGEVGLADEVVA